MAAHPLVGDYFFGDNLHPLFNRRRHQAGNRALDVVVRTLSSMYPGMSSVYTKPPRVANEHRALDIRGVVKITLTINTRGKFMALIPMDEPLAEKMARDSLHPHTHFQYLFFRDDPFPPPRGSVHDTILISPHAPASPYCVNFHYKRPRSKKHMIFVSPSPLDLVHFLDSLLEAKLGLVLAHAINYVPPATQSSRGKRARLV
jgi:hypothetical protein